MLLAFDTGNTNTVMGVFEDDTLIANWRFATDAQRTADEYGLLCHQFFNHHHIDAGAVEQIIISSVVPDLTATLQRMAKYYFHIEPLVIGAGIKTGINLRYENPKELGADRIVNAVAAIHLYGAPVIVVDFGTATTFCAINEKKEYLGGAITSGIGISMNALFEHAAKLPKVELTAPSRAIGRTTVEAMQSGLVFGYAALVDGMIAHIAKEMHHRPDDIFVVATGGRSEIICPHCQYVNEVNALLTLEGLRLLAQRNKGGSQ